MFSKALGAILLVWGVGVGCVLAHEGHHHHHGGHRQSNRHGMEKMETFPMTAILLTTVSSLAAALGGLFVVLLGVPRPALLGHLLSFAAGVMLFISYGDMVPDAAAELGAFDAGAWMFVGMLFFRGVVVLIPEPELGPEAMESAMEDAKRSGGGKDEVAVAVASKRRLFMTGLIAALGVTLHNFPEGLIVYTQTIHGVCREGNLEHLWREGVFHGLATLTHHCASRGLAVTIAIFLHNIPEGMAVASPIMAATGSASQALYYSLLSSLAEPLGAVLFGMVFNSFLTPQITATVNAIVAGIMIMLCIVELIPAAAAMSSAREAALTNCIGQLVMFLSLHAMLSAGMH